MGTDDIAGGLPAGITYCPECNAVLEIELWILEPKDVALLHVCAAHGVAAMSRPFS